MYRSGRVKGRDVTLCFVVLRQGRLHLWYVTESWYGPELVMLIVERRKSVRYSANDGVLVS